MASERPDPQADELAERWVSLYGDLALRTAYLFLRDRALAEDCVQDAFVSAWKARFSLRDPRAERGWLLTIVANTARSHLRRRIPPQPTLSRPIRRFATHSPISLSRPTFAGRWTSFPKTSER